MKIKRRIKKRVVKRKKPKLSLFKKLYNQLQADEIDARTALGWSETASDIATLDELSKRVSVTFVRLQIGGDWQATVDWTNYEGKLQYGKYPSKYSVKTSPSLLKAAILAYLEICDSAGKFV